MDQRYAELTRSVDTLMLALAKLEKEMKIANDNITSLKKSIDRLNRNLETKTEG
ncbi:hypothetical protein KKF45_05385 [Patescibacteria group bacterium]|nr:hypothetical protein [Patescibacteria group bacterium]